MTRVLVVDDDRAIAKLVQDILQGEGYLVECAGSAVAAFSSVAEQCPDILLLDLSMPVMDGWWTLLRLYRQDPRLVHLPVVVMSAAVEEHRAEELGVAFVAKPFDLDTLLGTIRDTLVPPPKQGCSPRAAVG
jgi:CheY-like chemotaxis protein